MIISGSSVELPLVIPKDVRTSCHRPRQARATCLPQHRPVMFWECLPHRPASGCTANLPCTGYSNRFRARYVFLFERVVDGRARGGALHVIFAGALRTGLCAIASSVSSSSEFTCMPRVAKFECGRREMYLDTRPALAPKITTAPCMSPSHTTHNRVCFSLGERPAHTEFWPCLSGCVSLRSLSLCLSVCPPSSLSLPPSRSPSRAVVCFLFYLCACICGMSV